MDRNAGGSVPFPEGGYLPDREGREGGSAAILQGPHNTKM